MIGVGIAGAGHFAAVHATALAALPQFRLVAVSATTQERSAAFAATRGGRPVADWRHLIDDKDIDVILVTLPHHLHAEAVIAAAQVGKHVIVEKPMAPTLAECRAMQAAATAAGTSLLVGQLMRYVLPCQAARAYLASGVIGRPRYGRSAMVKFWMESNRRDWHLHPETGGGMLMTAGIHALDRLVWLMDDDVAAVAAMAAHLFHDQAVPDADLLLLRFAAGGLGDLASVGDCDRTMWNGTELACEGGRLLLDFDRGITLLRDGRAERLPNSAEPDWMLRGVEREWRDLDGTLTAGTKLTVAPADAAHLIAVIEAARTAATERREVPVPAR